MRVIKLRVWKLFATLVQKTVLTNRFWRNIFFSSIWFHLSHRWPNKVVQRNQCKVQHLIWIRIRCSFQLSLLFLLTFQLPISHELSFSQEKVATFTTEFGTWITPALCVIFYYTKKTYIDLSVNVQRLINLTIQTHAIGSHVHYMYTHTHICYHHSSFFLHFISSPTLT